MIEQDDSVLSITKKGKAWLGTVKVMNVDKNWVWISGNGDYRKVPKSNVKLSTRKNGDIITISSKPHLSICSLLNLRSQLQFSKLLSNFKMTFHILLTPSSSNIDSLTSYPWEIPR